MCHQGERKSTVSGKLLLKGDRLHLGQGIERLLIHVLPGGLVFLFILF